MNNERFHVTYRIKADEKTAHTAAKIICLEQTVELSEHLVKDDYIKENIIGKIEHFIFISENLFEANISYNVETTGFELLQLLNVIFGNTSIKPNIQVYDIKLSDTLYQKFKGPRFGIKKIRKILNIYEKPLLCSALKPMGKSAEEMASMAYAFAKGGVDIIKDDHGLSNQSFCLFEDRVKACSDAVKKANRETGKNCLYAPHITGRYETVFERAFFAIENEAGALLISPGLCGFDTMLALSEDMRIDVPLISHPSFLGGMLTSPHSGFTHKILLGKMQRLAGADASIFPNYGGRFSFSREECESIKNGCTEFMGNFTSIFPMPGGGMNEERIPDMIDLYGHDVIFLMGGALFNNTLNISEYCKHILIKMGRANE
ncbi:MAG: RuBisCO large subunit C-terminal-like domain-containing protein [Spirochaetia bacterium]|nr:RuBisCO large subunit C-terminal-like domain-containing protein [Spirochaetia bacterium]